MNNRQRFIWLFALLALVTSLAALALWLPNRQTDTLRRVVILYTNDEHGYLEPSDRSAGAAGLLRLWRQREGWNNNPTLLMLSGGDQWTGPAISTVLQGESAVDVMNTLGYRAAAVGNHDFDFGLDALQARADQARFPLLSANVRQNGRTPDFARPYTILDINGVRVGVIGLTTVETPVDTRPSTVEGLVFLPYEQALRQVVPQARQEGAQLLVVAGHICENEMRRLAPVAAELGIAVLGGGHCHEEVASTASGVALVQSGSFWRAYGRVELLYDTQANQVARMEVALVHNPPGSLDPDMAERVQGWRAQAAAAYPGLWHSVGYAAQGLGRTSPEMASLLTGAWLEAYPAAQAALASPRYISQPLPPGEINPGSVVSLLPTPNQLLDVELTGAQMVEIIESRQALYGGLSEVDGRYLLAGGQPLEPSQIYHVLVPDVLFEGGNHYDFRQYSPKVSETGLDWQQAVIDWLTTHPTSPDSPLEMRLDPAGN